MALTSASNGFGVGALSIADITKEAENFQYDPEIALKYWFRSADAVHKQVCIYRGTLVVFIFTIVYKGCLIRARQCPGKRIPAVHAPCLTCE